jgi:hypothetical protein
MLLCRCSFFELSIGHAKRPRHWETRILDCGGCMLRCYPFAFIDINYVKEDVQLTSFVVEACELYVLAIKLAIMGYDKTNIQSSLFQTVIDTRLKRLLFDAACGNLVDLTKTPIGNCFFCAFFGLFMFDDYHNAIDAIIKLPGDTHTNATVTGGLLGAYYGYKHLSKEEFTKNTISNFLSKQVNRDNLSELAIYSTILYQYTNGITAVTDTNIQYSQKCHICCNWLLDSEELVAAYIYPYNIVHRSCKALQN